MPDADAKLNFKLGRHEPGVGMVEHRYDDVFCRGRREGREVLVVGPRTGHIQLLLELLVGDGPYQLVYVLLAALDGYPEGRYELDRTLRREQLTGLLNRYRAFFEGDARHHLLVSSSEGSPLAAYDQHNLLYFYSPSPEIEQRLRERGLTDGVPEMPTPHSHHIREEFDPVARELLGTGDWRRTPLREMD